MLEFQDVGRVLEMSACLRLNGRVKLYLSLGDKSIHLWASAVPLRKQSRRAGIILIAPQRRVEIGQSRRAGIVLHVPA